MENVWKLSRKIGRLIFRTSLALLGISFKRKQIRKLLRPIAVSVKSRIYIQTHVYPVRCSFYIPGPAFTFHYTFIYSHNK